MTGEEPSHFNSLGLSFRASQYPQEESSISCLLYVTLAATILGNELEKGTEILHLLTYRLSHYPLCSIQYSYPHLCWCPLQAVNYLFPDRIEERIWKTNPLYFCYFALLIVQPSEVTDTSKSWDIGVLQHYLSWSLLPSLQTNSFHLPLLVLISDHLSICFSASNILLTSQVCSLVSSPIFCASVGFYLSFIPSQCHFSWI